MAYLACLAAGLYWHVVGDAGALPGGQYFVTWDMFPGYRSVGSRIVVLGETEAGDFVRLYPSERHRRRSGMRDHLTRLDALANPFGAELEDEITTVLASHRHEEDPVRTVYVLREAWPGKFNLPEPAYERIALDGDPPRSTRTWTLVVTREARSFLVEPR